MYVCAIYIHLSVNTTDAELFYDANISAYNAYRYVWEDVKWCHGTYVLAGCVCHSGLPLHTLQTFHPDKSITASGTGTVIPGEKIDRSATFISKTIKKQKPATTRNSSGA